MAGISMEMKRINNLTSEINELYHEYSRKMGISDSVCVVLYGMCELGDGCTQNDICRQSGMSKQTVHSAVRSLQAQGYIVASEANGRSVHLSLTQAGQEMVREKIWPLVRLENDVLAGWKREELAEYERLIARMCDDIKERVQRVEDFR